MKSQLFIALLFLSVYFSHAINASVFPTNQLDIFSSAKGDITEEFFHEIIDQFENFYKPIIKKKGGILKIQRMWSVSEVNAYAGRFYPLFSITINGGLARHEYMTRDALTLALCHEMGHLLGSAPTKKQIPNRWASVEGQSDYFATLKCVRRIWDQDNNIEIISDMEIAPSLENECKKSFADINQVALCIRSATAAWHISIIMESINNDGPINFQTPDYSVVPRTLSDHPRSQCRLDTFLQGALCEVSYKSDLSKNNPKIGACNRSTNHVLGNRPLCWYKPKD